MEALVSAADSAQKFLAPLSICLSAWLAYLVYRATADAPVRAARLAAELQQRAVTKAERERRRLWIFATLMGARRTFYNSETVQAFNLIDVVFHDVRPVRQAWADLYRTIDDDRHNNGPGWAFRDDKLKTLLLEMARSLELSNDIGVDDISRVYQTEALTQQGLLESLERERRLKELRSAGAANQPPSSHAAI